MGTVREPVAGKNAGVGVGVAGRGGAETTDEGPYRKVVLNSVSWTGSYTERITVTGP